MAPKSKRESPEVPRTKYWEGVGRRKRAVARVRVLEGGSGFKINGEEVRRYFKIPRYEESALAPLRFSKGEKMAVSVKVSGGGLMAQSEAVRLGLARALVKFSPDLRRELRAAGFLTRDSRVVERKKFGLKKARRAPQWKKR